MTNDNWKTLRVPVEAYQEAKEQKEKEGRTWGEQLVCDNSSTTEVVDLSEVVEDMQQPPTVDANQVAQEVAKRIDYAEVSTQIARKVAEELQR